MRLGIVLPTIEGREDSFHRSLNAYINTTHDVLGGVYFQIERNHPTCGSAWDTGANALPDDVTHIHFAADDIEPEDGWWEDLQHAADMNMCASAIVLNPDGSLQSAGMSGGHPHIEIPPDWTWVEHTLTPFITRAQWDKVKPIPRDLHYCTDWWVSARLGVPVVVRTGSRLIHHNHPAGRGAGMEENARNLHDRALFHRYMQEASCASS